MLLILATIAACAILSNGPSLGGEFVFDDTEAIVGNSDVTGDTSLVDLFSHDFWGNDMQSNRSHKSYRPITVLSFRLDAYLGAGELLPAVFHLHNIALYALVCLLYRHVVLRYVSCYPPNLLLVSAETRGLLSADPQQVMKLIRLRPMGVRTLILMRHLTPDKPIYLFRLSGSSETADWSAVLFAAHPLHTEAVSGLVGRAELISALLYLLAILAWRNSLSPRGKGTVWLLVSCLLAGLAMLSKEQGVTVLGVCVAWEMLLAAVGRVKWSLKWHMCRLALYSVLGVSLLCLRWRIMAGTTPTFQVSSQ